MRFSERRVEECQELKPVPISVEGNSVTGPEVCGAHTLRLKDPRFRSLAFLLQEVFSPPYVSPKLITCQTGCADGLADVGVQEFVRFVVQLEVSEDQEV